jgi:hypothetical protein
VAASNGSSAPHAPVAAGPTGTGTLAAADAGQVALRAEHDALAALLATRASVDRDRRRAHHGLKYELLAWDWGWLSVNKPKPEGEYPLFFLLGALLTAVLLWFTVRAFREAAALRAVEAEGFRRLQALRARLELDT